MAPGEKHPQKSVMRARDARHTPLDARRRGSFREAVPSTCQIAKRVKGSGPCLRSLQPRCLCEKLELRRVARSTRPAIRIRRPGPVTRCRRTEDAVREIDAGLWPPGMA